MGENTLNTSEKRYTDNKTGKFINGNPGRPKGSTNKISLKKLEEAMEIEEAEAEKQGGVNILRHFVRKAYVNPNILIALMKKFIPDKTHTEIETPEPIKAIFEIVNAKDKSN